MVKSGQTGGNVISYPSEMYLPHSIDEVSAIVKHACQSGKTGGNIMGGDLPI